MGVARKGIDATNRFLYSLCSNIVKCSNYMNSPMKFQER